MAVETIKIETLTPAEYNPRMDLKPGDAEYDKLKKSIETYGYVELIVWNKRTGTVISGHQRLKVLKDLGYTEIECITLDLDTDHEKALCVAMNRIGGAWDQDKLASLVATLDENMFDVSLTGLDAAETDELLNKYYAQDAVEDDFDMEKAKSEIEAAGAITQKGNIWLLGKHRLMCGDSTSAADFERLMDGKHAQLAVTSPPSGADKDYEKNGIESWFGKMTPVISNVCRHTDIVCWNIADLFSTASHYIEPTSVYSVNLFAEHGFRPIWIRIWHKMAANVGTNSRPSQQYEWLTAFEGESVTEDSYNLQDYSQISAFAGHNYKFIKRLTKDERKSWGYSAIWEIKSKRTNKEHPVALPWRCIKIQSDSGDVVLDPFCGSGSTLIAAEQTDRICYAMEVSPVHCDLIVKRFREFAPDEEVIRLEGGESV